ncbi:PilX N-terminal domain-containing pilus assembly protein [Pseudomonas qingdaonensis]|nr:PilX N-terminal domain-containing pilus assembly protein [Pseudomonas qingdaonensis]
MKLQRGMALLVCLVLMLLCGLLGVSVLHSAALQARMAGNLVMALQAFEAAEATLRLAEARVLAGLEPPGPCVYCLPPPEAPGYAPPVCRAGGAKLRGWAGRRKGLASSWYRTWAAARARAAARRALRCSCFG